LLDKRFTMARSAKQVRDMLEAPEWVRPKAKKARYRAPDGHR